MNITSAWQIRLSMANNAQSYGTGDLNILHVDKSVIEDIIIQLNEKFGKERPLTTAQEKLM